MKKKILFALLLHLNLTMFAQIKYEKGFFIGNDGTKTDCYIKNMDWNNNPTEFNYKISKGEKVQKKTIGNVKLFNISGISEYVKSTINIDVSTHTNINYLDNNRNPIWKKHTVFLKVLVKGNSNLYLYKSQNINFKYFYKTNDKKIEQLVYKNYLSLKGDKATNLTYLYQLQKNVNCENKTVEQLRHIDYKQNSLSKYFEKDNLCTNPNSTSNSSFKKNKLDLNLRLTPGINSNSFSMQNEFYSENEKINFSSNLSFRIGLEIELVLPFNKNKWSFILEPNYHYYNNSKTYIYNNGTITIKPEETTKVKLNAIEIPFGFRHYIFLKNQKSKIFIDAMAVFEDYFSSEIKFKTHQNLDQINSSLHFAFGFGFNYDDHYSIEGRFYINKDPLSDYIYWNSSLDQFSIIFGYKFL